MIEQKQTGGPAFPLSTVDPYDRSVTTCDGMTLRDYFAAKAITGILAQKDVFDGTHVNTAWLAYQIADAMIEERNK